MDTMTTRRWFLILCLVLAAAMVLSWPLAAGGQSIRFAWAFGARIQEGQRQRIIPVTDSLSIQTGDALKFFLLPKTRCVVYLIHHGPRGEIAQLFPDPQKEAPQHLQPSRPYLIPPGRDWFVLDKVRGVETFYLLVSAVRLSGLESLLEAYRAAPAPDKAGLARKILMKIELLKRHFPDPAAAAQRPAQIGGSIRGTAPPKAGRASVADLAVEITADTLYSRTYTIDHR